MEFERRVSARRFVQLQARFKQKRKREKVNNTILLLKREGTRKVTEEGDTKGEVSEYTSPSGKLNQPACHPQRKCHCQAFSECDCSHPPECSHYKSQKWLQMAHGQSWSPQKSMLWYCVSCHEYGRSTRIESCVERRPRIYVLGTILIQNGWRPTKKQFSAILSKCGKTFPCKGKKRTFTGYYSLEIQKKDRYPNAPTCEDVHQQWTQHGEEESRIAAWNMHRHIFKIRGTHQEDKDTLFRTKIAA